MPPGKKQKPKSGKPRETRREEPATASAGGAGPSTSQEHADSDDEDTGRPEPLKAVHKRAGQTDCCVLRPTPLLLWYVSQGLQKQEQEKGPGPAVRPDHVHEW